MTLMHKRLKTIYTEFPSKFWVVVLTHFIDGIGGTLLFPFFALYITQKFNVGMTQAGVLLGLFSLFGLAGSMIGGALTDKFGRRRLALFGLVFSALSTLALGFVNDLRMMYPLSILIGLLMNIAGPAHQAMIADLLPEEQRNEGFGILRVVGNLAWIIGPTIGGFVASRSFLLLFILDAILSSLVAVIFYLKIPETRPETTPEKQAESILDTLAGYLQVLRDYAFVAFMLVGILSLVVYQQMYNTLSVYLRDVHGINSQGYGFLLTSSAITVVLLQFFVSRRIKYRPPFLMMALGTAFYMAGFSMFGFVSVYWLFALAVVIITLGEMVVVPTSQALAANFAPEDMRGRYMAVFGLSWAIPQTMGPAAAGLILDHYNPNLIWYIGGVLCALSAAGYYSLHLRLAGEKRFAPAAPDEDARQAVP
jgi:MFS family permease